LYDNGLRALVGLHAIEPGAAFDFLDGADEDSALAAHVRHLRAWHAWATPSLRFDRVIVDAALEFVVTDQPDDRGRSISWGDARVGNMIFGDELDVAALLDWEGARLGPVGIDVAWWVMFEDFFSVEQGTPRLDGTLDADATVQRYVELGGREIPHLGYYLVMAGLTFALINSRLADLYITHYGADPAKARTFIDRTTRMTAAYLDRFG
jgi:aminoglycoside phosphotransferase (APT) family kinase protein